MTRECDELRNKRTSIEVRLSQGEQLYKTNSAKYREIISKKKLLQAREMEYAAKGKEVEQLEKEIDGE